MCDYADIEMPQAFRRVWRKARKEHRCVECNRPIAKGTTYMFTSGVWDGRPDSFRQCERCMRTQEVHMAAERTMDPHYPGVVYGDLLATIRECMRKPEYRAAFRAARANMEVRS